MGDQGVERGLAGRAGGGDTLEPVGSAPTSAHPSREGWPVDGGPLPFEDITRPLVHAVRCAYSLGRKDRRRNIPWKGPEIGRKDRACSPLAAERLKANRLAYAENDHGRDALEEIIGLAVQLGIEQGRRIATSDHSDLLDKVDGAVLTLTIGWDHTHLHTQSGFLADPVECLRRAIGALTDEMARVLRCPRQKAICRDSDPKDASAGPKDAPQSPTQENPHAKG